VNAWSRYLTVSGLLTATSLPVSTLLVPCYGAVAARRFGVAMAGTLVAQQTLVGFALKGRGRSRDDKVVHTLSVVDFMTLSRGVSAAMLVGLMVSRIRDRRGRAGWLGWLALLYGAILCDWIDGPLARRFGTSDVGSLFDLESDSWLTLCAAGSAVAWGDLPATVAVPPCLRYLVMFFALRATGYAEVHVDEPPWARSAGMMQMLLFIAALAPFGGRGTWTIVRLVCPVQTPLQVAGSLVRNRHLR
jgi:phosphatidylglycerophosphate synthase